MGCCNCGGDTKKKRKLPLAGLVVFGVCLLVIYFWQ